MSASTPPPGYGAAPPPPPGNYGGPGGTPPPNHLVWAILSTLFCCLPLGVASIVFSAQVNSKWSAGDVAGAQQASEKARKFALWATIIGVVFLVLWVVLLIAGVANMDFSTTSTSDDF